MLKKLSKNSFWVYNLYMITIYRNEGTNLLYENIEDVDFETATKNTWIHIQNPTQESLEKISKATNLSIDYLSSALDEEETAHIEADEDDDITYVVLDTPYIKDPETGVYATAPFIIVFNENYFVTIANHEFELIPEVLKKVKKIETKKHVRLSTHFIFRLMTLYISYLKKIDNHFKEIEEKMSKSTKNKELYEMMDINKTLVLFSTALNSNRAVILKLFRLEYYKKFEEDYDLMDDARIECNQAIEMVSTYRDILKGSMDAYANIISNNLNTVMKTLAVVTIVISIPTLIASLFGMNFEEIPMDVHPYGFWITIGISAVLSVIGAIFLIIFTKNKRRD